MRLQLSMLAVCVMLVGAASLSSSSVSAQPAEPGTGQATSRVLVYDDNDATQVITSILDAEATLPGAVSLGTYALVDAVSSASVDVISAATGRWEETRVEVGGRASAPLMGSRYALGVTRSQENDWLSHSVLLSTSRALFQQNTVVSAGYAFTRNRVGRAMDPNFERSLAVHAMELAVSQLLDPVTRGGIAYTFQDSAGFQSSPYRYVSASDGSTLAERHPEKRRRHALSGFLIRSLAKPLSLRLGYRLYRDDWGIWSHTASLRMVYAITERVHAAVDGRYYIQNKADFYRGVYPTSFRYMSRDRELSSFWDAGGGGEVAVQLGPVKLDARLSAIYYRFRNFPALPERLALLAGGGARVEW